MDIFLKPSNLTFGVPKAPLTKVLPVKALSSKAPSVTASAAQVLSGKTPLVTPPIAQGLPSKTNFTKVFLHVKNTCSSSATGIINWAIPGVKGQPEHLPPKEYLLDLHLLPDRELPNKFTINFEQKGQNIIPTSQAPEHGFIQPSDSKMPTGLKSNFTQTVRLRIILRPGIEKLPDRFTVVFSPSTNSSNLQTIEKIKKNKQNNNPLTFISSSIKPIELSQNKAKNTSSPSTPTRKTPKSNLPHSKQNSRPSTPTQDSKPPLPTKRPSSSSASNRKPLIPPSSIKSLNVSSPLIKPAQTDSQIINRRKSTSDLPSVTQRFPASSGTTTPSRRSSISNLHSESSSSLFSTRPQTPSSISSRSSTTPSDSGHSLLSNGPKTSLSKSSKTSSSAGFFDGHLSVSNHSGLNSPLRSPQNSLTPATDPRLENRLSDNNSEHSYRTNSTSLSNSYIPGRFNTQPDKLKEFLNLPANAGVSDILKLRKKELNKREYPIKLQDIQKFFLERSNSKAYSDYALNHISRNELQNLIERELHVQQLQEMQIYENYMKFLDLLRAVGRIEELRSEEALSVEKPKMMSAAQIQALAYIFTFENTPEFNNKLKKYLETGYPLDDFPSLEWR